jgi:hypothetical protein
MCKNLSVSIHIGKNVVSTVFAKLRKCISLVQVNEFISFCTNSLILNIIYLRTEGVSKLH